MKTICLVLLITFFSSQVIYGVPGKENVISTSDQSGNYYSADDNRIQYVGRFDFSDPENPKTSYPGAYIKFRFTGTYCDLTFMTDTILYLSIEIDGKYAGRQRYINRTMQTIRIISGLTNTEHDILICRASDCLNRKLIVNGITCEKLLEPNPLSKRSIEFIGNSITSGCAMLGEFCKTREIGAADNTYLSYAPRTARKLDAEWYVSSIAGIGLIRSCCPHLTTMRDSYDRLYFEDSKSPKWDLSQNIPDVVTIALGHNDGIKVDGEAFVTEYISFIKLIRENYPDAYIVIMNTPGGKSKSFIETQRSWFAKAVEYFNKKGDDKVVKFDLIYGLAGNLNNGCGGHPSEAEHEIIANDLATFIKTLTGWQ